MAKTPSIHICLWFDNQAEEAAKFYTGIFKTARIMNVAMMKMKKLDIATLKKAYEGK